ncbi:MAG: glucose 1-dehydrogenase [Kiritimatiellae bacterium]|nr:glucose 1-dehydrogenase [Kiritimatiellia bacterium]
MKRELQGKNALVTGAGKGIGRGIALSLAKAGANVCIHYRSDDDEAKSLEKEILDEGVKCLVIKADLSNFFELEAMFAKIKETWKSLDTAINNAGWDPGYMDVTTISEELFNKLSDVNIKGTLFCCLNEIDLMKNNSTGGSIINIGSVQQDTSVKGRTLYATSKGAIHSMTGQLALECGELGIRVNNVAPGYIEVERMNKSAEFNRDQVAKDIPIGRIGNTNDVGEFVVYLASDKAGFITGQTLIIDGGVSRKLARTNPSTR